MSNKKEKQNKTKKSFVETPDGKLEILKSFSVVSENRKISLVRLADESIIINVIRYEESVDSPYENVITNQTMRLSKLTFSMLFACFFKADQDFEINADKLMAELNERNK
jgi:hypothetical protein